MFFGIFNSAALNKQIVTKLNVNNVKITDGESATTMFYVQCSESATINFSLYKSDDYSTSIDDFPFDCSVDELSGSITVNEEGNYRLEGTINDCTYASCQQASTYFSVVKDFQKSNVPDSNLFIVLLFITSTFLLLRKKE